MERAVPASSWRALSDAELPDLLLPELFSADRIASIGTSGCSLE